MKLLLVDDDPIFRLGFCTALVQATDWAIAAENFDTILSETPRQDLDLILCDPAWLGDRHWLRYRELQTFYPSTPVVLLTSQLDAERILQAKRDGISGYLPKGMAITALIPELQSIIAGGKVWSQQPRGINQNFLAGLRRRGLQQIYTNLDQVESYLAQENLPAFYRLVFAGQRRELRTAAWLLRSCLPQSAVFLESRTLTNNDRSNREPGAIIISTPLEITTSNTRWQSSLEQTFIKLNGPLSNATTSSFELEVIAPAKRRELLYIILQQLNFIFNDPQWRNLELEQFSEQCQYSIRNLWKFSAQEFIGRYNLTADNQAEGFLALLNRVAIANTPALNPRLPHNRELFAYFLRDEPLTIDNVTYRLESQEAIARSQQILEHLLLTLANDILQFVLNTLPEPELLKAEIYQPKLRSARAIARFRNDLSWHYRLRQYWLEPKAIFESQHHLLTLGNTGIVVTTIHSPRYQELASLRGIPWAVTILLELRDALAPRVRAIISWLGKILVYLLTNVVGRALGLIARGIVDGAGSSWQSLRSRQVELANGGRKNPLKF
ncbi:two-component response regulator ycf55-like protein [[Synechococcus] sp. NIES-970]|nr:two-component response regulator ycf55-like protein [[Synechococcus] sp. NIES-970]